MNKKWDKCEHVSPTNQKCLRPKTKNSVLCKYHSLANKFKSIVPPASDECPICLDSIINDELILSCSHKAHKKCISEMIKLECPLCRAPIDVLDSNTKEKIEKKGAEYLEEVREAQNQEFFQNLERERALENLPLRLPPQAEIMLALKYVVQLGIPVSLIPTDILLELNLGSPLPAQGSIFQNTVRYLMDVIRQNAEGREASGSPLILGDDGAVEESDDDSSSTDDFEIEGNNLQIIHRIRTILSDEQAVRGAGTTGTNIMSFRILDFPDVTQEDLINLGMGRRLEDDTGAVDESSDE